MIEMVIHFIFWFLGFVFLYKIHTLSSGEGKGTERHFSVIIPARNEECNIGNLLQSLKVQAVQPDEVIVVDDGSTDSTAGIAGNFGAKVIQIKALPKNWTGKNWACLTGARNAQNETLLFLDADVTIEPGGLEALLDTQRERQGVITVQPYHEIKRPFEEFSSFLNIILLAGMGAFTVFGKKAGPQGVFGPCLLIRKTDFLNVFRNESVRRQVLEDMEIGKALNKKGIPIHYFGGKGFISFRMYPKGIKDLFNGWSKSFFSGAKSTHLPVLIMVILWISGSIGSIRFLVTQVMDFSMPLFFISIGLYFCYVIQLYWMLRQAGRFRFLTALLFPVPLLFFFLVFITSFYRTVIGKKISWKGRDIKTRE
ncbi:MAG: glycosyltransferase family 2 protein [Spirochaetales bacterium]|nr:glycosyltransferase family 2 protein [Spirochaetales bacterium]